jgi:hypothetical protein
MRTPNSFDFDGSMAGIHRWWRKDAAKGQAHAASDEQSGVCGVCITFHGLGHAIAACQEKGQSHLQEEGMSDSSYEVGKSYFFRTVTYHYLGQVAQLTDTDIVLINASWVADSGRWSEALKTGKLSEVEPYPDPVIIQRAAVVDATIWRHDLPKEVK